MCCREFCTSFDISHNVNIFIPKYFSVTNYRKSVFFYSQLRSTIQNEIKRTAILFLLLAWLNFNPEDGGTVFL
jgi:hypothetical protein